MLHPIISESLVKEAVRDRERQLRARQRRAMLMKEAPRIASSFSPRQLFARWRVGGKGLRLRWRMQRPGTALP